jgi:hypothetical protein
MQISSSDLHSEGCKMLLLLQRHLGKYCCEVLGSCCVGVIYWSWNLQTTPPQSLKLAQHFAIICK